MIARHDSGGLPGVKYKVWSFRDVYVSLLKNENCICNCCDRSYWKANPWIVKEMKR